MGWEDFFAGPFLIAFLAATIRMAAPLLLAAIGELFAQRSGVTNLGIEGMMVIAALAGFLASYFTGSPWLGVLAAIIAGMLASLIHAFLSVSVGANQFISGIVLSLFGLGVTSYIFRVIVGIPRVPPTANPLESIHVPVLSKIPVLGPILFQSNILVYLGLVLVPLSAFILFRTTAGLKIRAVGENPRAADSLGINVNRIRYLCIIFGGAMAGLAGVFLSLGHLNLFLEGMVAGRGWMAFALVFFGSWNPYRILGGALIFGGVEAFQFRLPAIGIVIPSKLLLMLPYIAVIIALLLTYRKKIITPAALGVPYRRGESA